MIVVPHQRRIYSNFTGELYIHIRSGTRPLTYAREKCRVENFGRHPAIHLGEERGKYLEMKEEWRRWWWNMSKCKKMNISLHIYLFSLEMRGRSTTTREAEAEKREMYFISPPSFSPSLVDNADMREERERERKEEGFNWWTNSLRARYFSRWEQKKIETSGYRSSRARREVKGSF